MAEVDTKLEDDKQKDDVDNNVDDKQEPDGKSGDDAAAPKSIEEAVSKLKEMEAEIAKNAELLRKVRKYEKENKEKAELALKEQGKYKELYEAELAKRGELEARVNNTLIDSALENVLKEAKVVATATAIKLIDRSKIVVEDGKVDTKSLQQQVDQLRKTDPVLFGNTSGPAPKKPGEGEPTGGYEKELSAAKTAQQIYAVMKKYGKMA